VKHKGSSLFNPPCVMHRAGPSRCGSQCKT